MAAIRASCPDCGIVEIASADVMVRVCATNKQGSYAFRCPECQMAVSKLADSLIVDLLVSSDVALTVWRLPAELQEQRVGEPITYDDLLEFHRALQQQDWFERLSVGRGDQHEFRSPLPEVRRHPGAS